MKKFECHITVVPGIIKNDAIKEIVEARGWKFSCIEGDPDLGAATYCYATRWFEEEQHAITMTHMFKDQFISDGLFIIRAKVERVIQDCRLVAGVWKDVTQ
jgi:hypothetical protein